MTGPANISGKIVGVGAIHAMICAIHYECSACPYIGEAVTKNVPNVKMNAKPSWL